MFTEILKKYSIVQVTTSSSNSEDAFYICKCAPSIADVLENLEKSADKVTISDLPKIIVLMAYSYSKDPILVKKVEMIALAQLAKASSDALMPTSAAPEILVSM